MVSTLFVLVLNVVICYQAECNADISVSSSSSEHDGIPDDRKYIVKSRRQYAGPINLHYDKVSRIPLPRPIPRSPDLGGGHHERWFQDGKFPPQPSSSKETKFLNAEDLRMLQAAPLHEQRSDFMDYINSIEKIFDANWEEKAKKSGKWEDVELYMEAVKAESKKHNASDRTIYDPDEFRREMWKHKVNIYRIINTDVLEKVESKDGRTVTEKNDSSEENETPPPPPKVKPHTGFQAYWEDPDQELLTPATTTTTTTTSKPPKIPPKVMMKMALEKLKNDYDKDGNLLPHKQQEFALAALPKMVNFWETHGNASIKNYRGWQNHQYAYGQQLRGQRFPNLYQQQNYYRQQYPQGFQGASIMAQQNFQAYPYNYKRPYTRRFGNQFGQIYNGMAYGQQPMRMLQKNVQQYQPQSMFYQNRVLKHGRQFYSSQNGQQYGGYGNANGQQYGGYGNQFRHAQQIGRFGQGYGNQMPKDFSLNNEDQVAKNIKYHQAEQNLIKLTNRFNNLGNPTETTDEAPTTPNQGEVTEPPKKITVDQAKLNKIMFRAKNSYLSNHAHLPRPAFMTGSENAKVRPTMVSFKPTRPAEVVMTEDDFGAPIKWVKSTSNKTKDGLAQVTDPVTGRQRTLKINGTLFLPIPDMDLGRLDDKFKTTTKRPSTAPGLRTSYQDTAVQTMMRNTELNLLNEADWLAFEVALGQNFVKKEVLECDSSDCQARCMRSGCEATCNGNTCATGCVGRECSAYCSGEGCMSMCIGEDCTSKCDGMACDSRCIGKPCKAECKSFNCYLSVNGDGKIGGGKFDDHYADMTGALRPGMPDVDRAELVDYN